MSHPKPSNITPSGLQKALDLTFLCNTIGNCVGWGSLTLVIIGLKSLEMQAGFFQWLVIPGIYGAAILPIVVPAILLINLGVAVALCVSKLKHGSFPRFNRPRRYFITGAISACLFYLGSALFELMYLSAINAPD